MVIREEEMEQTTPEEMEQTGSSVSEKTLMTKEEFYKHPVMKRTSGNIKASAIVLYVCGGMTLMVDVLLWGNFFSLINVLIVIGTALGIHLAKSRVCAAVVLSYSILNIIIAFYMNGSMGGYLLVLAGVYALFETCKFQKAWKQYLQKGTYPGLL